MLTRTIRRNLKRREGQALVLAALMVLILSLAALATINLGHNITERVRLQNTADAAAYSMAAMEARAFNFYAFANRTQVSHYVAAMVWQSMLSFVYFLEAFFTDVLGVILTLNVCGPQSTSLTWVAICTVLKALPVVGPIITGLVQALTSLGSIVEQAVRALQGTLRFVNPDFFIGRVIIPAHRILNHAFAGLSEVTLVGTMEQVLTTSNDVIADNDPNIDSLASRAVSGALSACILERAHMRESGISARNAVTNPGAPFAGLDPSIVEEQEKVARAKRSMGKIANATRFACDRVGSSGSLCGPGWVTDRRPGQIIPLPGNFGLIRDVINSLDWKWGQTKMLSHGFSVKSTGSGPADDRNYIRDWRNDLPNAPISDLTQGDAIGSDDIYQIKIGPDRIGVDVPIAGNIGIDNPLSCKVDDDPLKCWGDNRKGLNDNGEMPFRHTVKPSIWAMSDSEVPGGLHWRVVTDKGINPGSTPGDLPNLRAGGWGSTVNSRRDIGLNVFEKKLIDLLLVSLNIDIWVANVRKVADQNHPWEGLAAFPHFEPGEYGAPCGQGLGSGATPKLDRPATRAEEFNQPSTWVILNKNPAQLQNPLKGGTGAGNNVPAMLNSKGAITFALASPTKLTLDNTRKTFLGAKGLNVVARGQAYYHRPGNWAEQPNFFNPYWKPRLASVWQGRYSLPLIGDLANMLPGPLKDLPPKIITH